MAAVSLALAACTDGDADGDADDDEPRVYATLPPASATTSGDGELFLGTLLPQTGGLRHLGPPQIADVDLAMTEINEAGGILGQETRVAHTDSGDTASNLAVASTGALLTRGVDAIVGAASSAVTRLVIDDVVQSGTVLISPANTATDLTDWADDGFYFRTAPPDTLQGRVVGDLVIDDGRTSVGVLALEDIYGESLAENVARTVDERGGGIAGGGPIVYDPAAPNFAAEVSEMASRRPDAILLIGFDDSLTILAELVGQGVGPQDVPLYLVDGNLALDYTSLAAGTMNGVKATQPGSPTSAEFRQRLLGVNPDLVAFSYAGEAYDATVLLALAATAASDDGAPALAATLVDVSTDGAKCTTFAECRDLLEDGADIDYDGISGPIEFNEAGDPTEAAIGIYQFGADNTFTNVDFRFGRTRPDPQS
ncbi:MAG: ABC transporter substrate-binding protein [Jiangellaceae bacterium]